MRHEIQDITLPKLSEKAEKELRNILKIEHHHAEERTYIPVRNDKLNVVHSKLGFMKNYSKTVLLDQNDGNQNEEGDEDRSENGEPEPEEAQNPVNDLVSRDPVLDNPSEQDLDAIAMFNATITKTIPALKPFQSMNKVPKLNFTVDLRETLQTLKTRAPKSARNPQKITSYNKSDIFESMKNHEVTLLKNINPEHSFKMVDISSFQSKAPRDVPNNYVNLTEKKETNEKLSPSFDFDPDRVYNRKRMSLKKFEYSIL